MWSGPALRYWNGEFSESNRATFLRQLSVREEAGRGVDGLPDQPPLFRQERLGIERQGTKERRGAVNSGLHRHCPVPSRNTNPAQRFKGIRLAFCLVGAGRRAVVYIDSDRIDYHSGEVWY
jgi:hypothetical protein